MRASSSLFLLTSCLVLSACGTPGDPAPPQPAVPEAVADLAARQEGDAVVLTFSLPRRTLEGEAIVAPPDVEILRGFQPAGEAPRADAARLALTIPGALVDTFLDEGRVRYRDPWKPEEVARRAGSQVVYVVRTRLSPRRASDDSNPVALRLLPVPETITDLAATVTEPAIELRWTPPARTTGGQPLDALGAYRLYRAQLSPAEEAAVAAGPARALADLRLRGRVELVGVSPAAAFRDTDFEFGRTYLYAVRSVAQYETGAAESADSAPVVLTPRDVFPPAAPAGVVAVGVAARDAAPAAIELSWSQNVETDLAGYHVYRMDEADTGRRRLNTEPLLTPTFRDTSIQPGRRYTYVVTAVDRAGNESPPSEAVTEGLPEPSPASGRPPG